MALTPEQKRSMDRYLYRGNVSNGCMKTKRKDEFEKQERLKANTETVLDDALKVIEG